MEQVKERKRNHIELEGRAFKIERRQTNSGMPILQFSMGFRNRKNKVTEEWENDWIKVIMFGEASEKIELEKAQPVEVIGYFKVDQWRKTDGATVDTPVIVATEIFPKEFPKRFQKDEQEPSNDSGLDEITF